MFKKSIISIALATSLLPSINTQAADDSVIHQGIDEQVEVLVVIGKTPRKVQDVVGSVSVINSETIDNQLVHNLADLMRYEVGINVVNSGNRFGDSSIGIRGISGNRIATEVDGVPLAEQFDIGSYSNSGRNLIDPDLIKQVEILRGPASSTYGNDAIGGVVSYITKKPSDLLSQTENDMYFGLKTGYYSVDDSNLVSLNTAFASGKSSALVSASLRSGHEFDSKSSSDIAKDKQNNETKSLLVKYYYEISDTQELSFSYDYFKRESNTDLQSILGPARFGIRLLLLGDDETQRESFVVNYEFVLDSDYLEGGVIRFYDQKSDTQQLTDENRTETNTRTKITNDFNYDRDFFYEQKLQGFIANLYTNIESSFATQYIGYGIEFSKNKIKELRDSLQTNIATGDLTNKILGEEFPVRDFPISEVEKLGVYINDEIKLDGTAITIIPAIRYDKYRLTPKPDNTYLADNPTSTVVNISEDSVSPKLGVVYQVNSDSELYVQYASGYRSPPFGDAYIGLDIPTIRYRVIPNPDLKSETTDGYEIGYSFERDQHKVELVGFYNDYQDFIQTKVNLGYDRTVERVIFQSQNINAEIYGAEFSYKGSFEGLLSDNDSFTTYANLFWSKGENKDSDQPLNEIEPNHALFGLQWLNSNEDLSVALHANVVDAKSDIDPINPKKPTEILALATTAGYATFDIIVNYHINNKLTVSAAVNNLTDRQYWQWSTVNGFEEDDPLLATLAAPGINGSLQLKYAW